MRRDILVSLIDEQRKWIEDHGGTKAGYIARYGAAGDSEHYGNGGEAIYDADKQRLENLEFQLEQKDRA
jgi:hypothetical protein